MLRWKSSLTEHVFFLIQERLISRGNMSPQARQRIHGATVGRNVRQWIGHLFLLFLYCSLAIKCLRSWVTSYFSSKFSLSLMQSFSRSAFSYVCLRMQFDETVTTPIQHLQRTPTEAIAQQVCIFFLFPKKLFLFCVQPSVNEFRPKSNFFLS